MMIMGRVVNPMMVRMLMMITVMKLTSRWMQKQLRSKVVAPVIGVGSIGGGGGGRNRQSYRGDEAIYKAGICLSELCFFRVSAKEQAPRRA